MKGDQFRPIDAPYLSLWRERIYAEQYAAATLAKEKKRKPKPSKKKEAK